MIPSPTAAQFPRPHRASKLVFKIPHHPSITSRDRDHVVTLTLHSSVVLLLVLRQPGYPGVVDNGYPVPGFSGVCLSSMGTRRWVPRVRDS
eukprot:3273277-Rhodomonas_salina.1